MLRIVSLPKDVIYHIIEYLIVIQPAYRLVDWIRPYADKLTSLLAKNPCAFDHFASQFMNATTEEYWELQVMFGPSLFAQYDRRVINLVKGREKHLMWMCWFALSANPYMISFLEKNLDKVSWVRLSENPAAISLLAKNLEKVDWGLLSENPAAIPILKRHIDKIEWRKLSSNSADDAAEIWENHLDQVDWSTLSSNPSPAAICFLEKHIERADWEMLSANPAAVHLLEKHVEKVCKKTLCFNSNPDAIRLLESQFQDFHLNWRALCGNPAAIHLLESVSESNVCSNDWMNLWCNPAAGAIIQKHIDKADWIFLSSNPCIFQVDELLSVTTKQEQLEIVYSELFGDKE